MLSLRRWQIIVLGLIVGVLTLGFMLTGDVVQESLASDSDCDSALQKCYRANFESFVICAGNSDSDACHAAIRKATGACLAALIICSN